MQTIREYLTLDERERAAYMAGNYELAAALQQIDALEQEISRLQYLLTDNGVNYAQNDD
jgi:ubiquinone biosynthesis protein UbiJ